MTCSALRAVPKSVLFCASLLAPSLVFASADCLLRPAKETRVSSDVSGVLNQLLVSPGKRVRDGDILARLNTGVIDARITQKTIDVEFSQREIERAEMAGTGAVTSAELDQLRSALNSASAELEELEAEKERLIIRAPHSGVVVDVLINEGEQVSESHVLELVDVSKLKVEANFVAQDYPVILASDSLQILGPNNEPTVANIEFIEPMIDAASNTFRVVALVDSEPGLLAGQSCTVQL